MITIPARSSILVMCLLAAAALPAAAQGNTPPVANPDTVITRTQRAPLLVEVLANDTDEDGGTLRIVSLGEPEHGTVAESNGQITYQPRRSFNGFDTFSYDISDGQGGFATGEVTIRNPFLLGRGLYAAAVAGDPAAHENAGYVQVNVLGTGSFTAQVRFAGDVFRFKAQFPLDGAFAGDLVGRGGVRTITLNFPIDDATGEIAGNLAGIDFTALRNPFNNDNPAPREGRYTLLLPATPGAGLPPGTGFAALRIRASGRAELAGRLGDGESWSSLTLLTPDGTLPVYAAIYRRPGSVFGTIEFTDGTFVTLAATMQWFKPRIPNTPRYPRGFRTTSDLRGSSYTPPEVGAPVVAVNGADPNAQFTASSGGILRPRVETAVIGGRPAAGKYNIPISNRLRIQAQVVVEPRTGIFRGSFVHRLNFAVRRFSGAFLQSESFGAGNFRGVSTSGKFEIGAFGAAAARSAGSSSGASMMGFTVDSDEMP